MPPWADVWAARCLPHAEVTLATLPITSPVSWDLHPYALPRRGSCVRHGSISSTTMTPQPVFGKGFLINRAQASNSFQSKLLPFFIKGESMHEITEDSFCTAQGELGDATLLQPEIIPLLPVWEAAVSAHLAAQHLSPRPLPHTAHIPPSQSHTWINRWKQNSWISL